MEELLLKLVEQNEKILVALESMNDKLDVLEEIHQSIETLDASLSSMEIIPPSMEADIIEMKYSISSIDTALQWHQEMSSAAQIIKAVEGVAEAIREQR